MYASKHPFRDDLVLEISEHEILELHGALLTTSGSNVANALLSILEAFNAGTDMSRFDRTCDTCDGTVSKA